MGQGRRHFRGLFFYSAADPHGTHVYPDLTRARHIETVLWCWRVKSKQSVVARKKTLTLTIHFYAHSTHSARRRACIRSVRDVHSTQHIAHVRSCTYCAPVASSGHLRFPPTTTLSGNCRVYRVSLQVGGGDYRTSLASVDGSLSLRARKVPCAQGSPTRV